VVLVFIPFVDGPGGKKRPAMVVQGDRWNATLRQTIVVAIPTNLKGVRSPAQLLIDPLAPEGRASGILHKSSIRCDRLFTVEQAFASRTIGHLAPSTMAALDDCLRASLDLPDQSSPGPGTEDFNPRVS
jgi:mRNA-degrading endonuclease toxin of MazEF toxin-antitoxin module